MCFFSDLVLSIKQRGKYFLLRPHTVIKCTKDIIFIFHKSSFHRWFFNTGYFTVDYIILNADHGLCIFYLQIRQQLYFPSLNFLEGSLKNQLLNCWLPSWWTEKASVGSDFLIRSSNEYEEKILLGQKTLSHGLLSSKLNNQEKNVRLQGVKTELL